MDALLIAVVLAILYLWWMLFRWSFGLIDRAHAELRDIQPIAEEMGKPKKVREV